MYAHKLTVFQLTTCLFIEKKRSKLRWLWMLAFCVGGTMIGQAQTQITGLVSSPDQAELSFANVLLLKEADSTLVKGAVSNVDGTYLLEAIPNGNYILSVSMVGYADGYSEKLIVQSAQNLTINISTGASGTALEEVEVVARKALFEQKIDRLVINVQNSITSAGSSVLEVLERSPGVNVNQQSNTIDLRGKSGLTILINGKQSRVPQTMITEMLRNMNADNIEKIEIFTTPPAEYDAEGDAGVINIQLKKREGDGWNGSYSLNAGYSRRLKTGASFNYNYRKNKFNLYGNYSPSWRQSFRRYNFERIVDKGTELLITNTFNNNESTSFSNRGRLGMDYDLSDKTVVGFLFASYYNQKDDDSENNGVFQRGTEKVSSVDLLSVEENNWSHWMTNFNIKHKFQPGQTLSFDADYLFYQHLNPSGYVNTFFDEDNKVDHIQELRVDKKTPIKIFVSKIDYKHSIGDKSEVSVGAKATFSDFSNDVLVDSLSDGVWLPLDFFSQSYSLAENIGAAYVSFSTQFNERTRMILGLRYELTDGKFESPSEAEPQDRSFDNFFPSLFLSHSLNDNNQFQISYARRITRPSFVELSPFVTFLDPTTYFSGNSNLQAAISNILETNYQYKTFRFSLYYSFDENLIARYQPKVDNNNNVQFYTTENLTHRHMLDLSVNFPIYVNKWWEIQNSFVATYQTTKIDENEATNNIVERSLWMGITNSFELPKGFALELSGRFQSASYYGILRTAAKGAIDFGIQKKIGGGTFRFNISDIFVTNIWQSNTVIPELGLNTSLVFDIETRIFRVSYSHPFGNKKVKKRRRRATGSAAERRRVN